MDFFANVLKSVRYVNRGGKYLLVMVMALSMQMFFPLLAEAQQRSIRVNGIVLDETDDAEELKWREIAAGFFA